MNIVKVFGLFWVAFLWVVPVFLFGYIRYFLEVKLRREKSQLDRVLSISLWLFPLVTVVLLSWFLFAITEDFENVYYLGYTHLILCYLAGLFFRKLSLYWEKS